MRRQIAARAVEHERITRDIATTEKRLRNLTLAVGDADDPETRADLVQGLGEQRRRLTDLRAALVRFDAEGGTSDPDVILRDLERFTATRTPDGWALEARVSRAFVFDKAGTNQKKGVKGDVSVITATPVTSANDALKKQLRARLARLDGSPPQLEPPSPARRRSSGARRNWRTCSKRGTSGAA